MNKNIGYLPFSRNNANYISTIKLSTVSYSMQYTEGNSVGEFGYVGNFIQTRTDAIFRYTGRLYPPPPLYLMHVSLNKNIIRGFSFVQWRFHENVRKMKHCTSVFLILGRDAWRHRDNVTFIITYI